MKVIGMIQGILNNGVDVTVPKSTGGSMGVQAELRGPHSTIFKVRMNEDGTGEFEVRKAGACIHYFLLNHPPDVRPTSDTPLLCSVDLYSN